VQAQVVSLAQQNTATINAIQKTQQNADAQIAKVAGNVDALTKVNAQTAADVGNVKAQVANISQNSFRLESWLAQNTDGWRIHWVGVDTYHPGDPADAPAPVQQGRGGDVVGKPGGVPDGARNVRGGAAADSGRPVPDSSRSAAAPIKKGGEHHMWYLIFGIVIGIIACQVFEALEPAAQAKATAEEESLYGLIVKVIHGAYGMIFGKKKTTAPVVPATPVAPPNPPAQA
jgi:hypothetical protein